jgi:GNAT superfamily N-acetyltransferase
MVTNLTFIQETSPNADTIKAIEEGLVDYNTAIAGYHNHQSLWLIGRDEQGHIQAGLKGVSFFQWLFVDWLWIAENVRKQGYGSRLLLQAEQVAKERNCVGIFLDTYSFQAPEFYAKHGYKECGRINNFPPGHERIYLFKTIGQQASVEQG